MKEWQSQFTMRRWMKRKMTSFLTHTQTNRESKTHTHTHTYKQEAYIFMGMGVNTALSTQMTAWLTKKQLCNRLLPSLTLSNFIPPWCNRKERRTPRTWGDEQVFAVANLRTKQRLWLLTECRWVDFIHTRVHPAGEPDTERERCWDLVEGKRKCKTILFW